MILFVMGIMLAVGVVKETGAYDELMEYLGVNDSQPFVWLHGVAAGVLSTVLDNFATAINFSRFLTRWDKQAWHPNSLPSTVAMVCIGGSLPSA